MRIPPFRRYLKDVNVRTDAVIVASMMMMLGTLAVSGCLIASIMERNSSGSAQLCLQGGVSTQQPFHSINTLGMENVDETCTQPSAPVTFTSHPPKLILQLVYCYYLRWLHPVPTPLYLIVGILVLILWKIEKWLSVVETLVGARVARNNQNEHFANAGGTSIYGTTSTTGGREGGAQTTMRSQSPQQQQQPQQRRLQSDHRHHPYLRPTSTSLVEVIDDCLSSTSLEDNLRIEKYSNHVRDTPPTSTAARPSDGKPAGSDTSTTACCPICLLEFEEGQWVTFCEPGGCNNIFHKECLFAWLQHSTTTSAPANEENAAASVHYNTSCPCCRREMIPVIQPSDPTTTNDIALRRQPAWLSDLSTFMGYYVH